MSNKVVRLQEVYDVGSKAVYIKKLFDTCMINDDAIDVLSDLDEAFLERYIGGIEPDKEEIQEKLSLYASEEVYIQYFVVRQQLDLELKTY